MHQQYVVSVCILYNIIIHYTEVQARVMSHERVIVIIAITSMTNYCHYEKII
jgi:hypothetical protein